MWRKDIQKILKAFNKYNANVHVGIRNEHPTDVKEICTGLLTYDAIHIEQIGRKFTITINNLNIH